MEVSSVFFFISLLPIAWEISFKAHNRKNSFKIKKFIYLIFFNGKRNQ